MHFGGATLRQDKLQTANNMRRQPKQMNRQVLLLENLPALPRAIRWTTRGSRGARCPLSAALFHKPHNVLRIAHHLFRQALWFHHGETKYKYLSAEMRIPAPQRAFGILACVKLSDKRVNEYQVSDTKHKQLFTLVLALSKL